MDPLQVVKPAGPAQYCELELPVLETAIILNGSSVTHHNLGALGSVAHNNILVCSHALPPV